MRILLAFGVAALTIVFGAVHTVDAAPSPPPLSWTTPAYDNTPTFTWESVLEAASYEVAIDQGTFVNLGKVFTYTATTPLVDGKHSFAVRAKDGNGVAGDANDFSYFVIDTTLPVVSGVSPATATAGVAQTFTVTYSDAVSVENCEASSTCSSVGVKHCDFFVNDSNVGAMTLSGSSSGTASFSTVLQGTSTVQAQCSDDATNVGLGAVTTVTVPDTTPPSAPTNLARLGSDNEPAPSFSWSAATDNATVAGYEVSLDGGAYKGIGNVVVYSPGALSAGSHVISVRTKDAVGNVSSPASLSFTIVAPLASPSDSSLLTPPPTATPAPAPTFTLDQMSSEARLIMTGSYAELRSALGSSGCELSEVQGKARVASVFGYINNASVYFELVAFTACGTISTRSLGSGERAGVVASYLSAFGHLPATEADWNDVIKISNGRFPAATSTSAEAAAKTHFRQIYLREPDMNQQQDKAAVTIMAYGLRPLPRNLNSEAAAITTFSRIFKIAPRTAIHWDEVRAIAYSGARR